MKLFVDLDAICTQCGVEFRPSRPLQAVCGLTCAKRSAIAAKKAKKASEREMTKARKESLKTIANRIEEAQTAFNAYIRLRDRLGGFACISSARALDWDGNAVDAGHYRSTGAAPHLRFNENNCHAQSKQDNRWLAGNAADYRVGLVARIGVAAVEALEADNAVHKWTHEELKEIAAKYRSKRKQLERERE